MAEMQNPTRIKHTKLGREATVPAKSLSHWRKRGWTLATKAKDKDSSESTDGKD